MKFRHTFHVFVDNFSVTYKHLLYRLVVSLIAIGLCIAVIIPFINGLTSSPDFASFTEGLKTFLNNLLSGNVSELAQASEQIKNSFSALKVLISDNISNIVWGIVAVSCIRLVEKFFTGLGNYAAAAVINDKMALRANSPFFVTLIRNLKQACLYNLMYVPLSFVYDTLCWTGMYFLIFRLFSKVSVIYLPLKIFIYATAIVILIAVKMTFTTDWLPSLIRGKKGQKQAFIYTFDRKNKNTFNILSNFVVLILIIFAVNVAGIICTLGVAALLTIPSSYLILLCFEFVNYYDREELKYFVDRNTIVKPAKEHPVTREEFFKGE